MRYPALIVAVATLALAAPPALAGDDALVVYKSLSPELALEAAQAAMKKCRDNGFQIAVAVVDRGGTVEAMAAAEGLEFRAILTAPDLGFPYEGA